MNERPKVGVGVIIRKDKKILLLKRKGAHGQGTWAFIGGHLEMNESLEDCARREVWEETGVRIKNIKPATFTNDIFPKEEKHYVTLYLVADYSSGKVTNKEPDKADRIDWFDWDNFPKPLFICLKNLRKTSFNPFDF